MGMIPVVGHFNEEEWLKDAAHRRERRKFSQGLNTVLDGLLADLERAEVRGDRDEQERIWRLISDASR